MNHDPPRSGEDPDKFDITSHSGLNIIPESLEILSENLSLNDALPGLVKHEPTALLLDINNLYRRVDDEEWRPNYPSLKKIFEDRCDLRYCAAFSAVDRSSSESIRWSEYMTKVGYDMRTKDLKKYKNFKGEDVRKGNMDIELTIKALSLSSAFTHIIIGSCDGDFVPLIEELKKDECRKVSILGLAGKNRIGISVSLIKAADNFYNMSDFKSHVEYIKRRSS